MRLKLSVLNIQCLISTYCNKLECGEGLSIFENNDVVMFSETWSHESLDLNVPHFQHFSLHRMKSKTSKRNSGGIVIYIRDYLVNDKSLFFLKVKMTCYGYD